MVDGESYDVRETTTIDELRQAVAKRYGLVGGEIPHPLRPVQVQSRPESRSEVDVALG